jgi:hypothetical protein
LLYLSGHYRLRNALGAKLPEQAKESTNITPLEPVHLVNNVANCRLCNSFNSYGNNRTALGLSLSRYHAGQLRAAGDQRQRFT